MLKLKKIFLFLFLFFSSINFVAALFGKKNFDLTHVAEYLNNEKHLFSFLEKEFDYLVEKRIQELNLGLDKPYDQDILKMIYEEELTLIFSSILEDPEVFYEFYKKLDSDLKNKLFKKLENDNKVSLRIKEILENMSLNSKENSLSEKDSLKIIFLNKEDCLENEGFSMENEICFFNFIQKKDKKQKVNIEICKDYGYFWNQDSHTCEYRFPKKFFISHSFNDQKDKCQLNHLPWNKETKYILIKEKEKFFCIQQANLFKQYFKNYKQKDNFYIIEIKTLNQGVKEHKKIKIDRSTFNLEYETGFSLLGKEKVLRAHFLYLDFSIDRPRIFFEPEKKISYFLEKNIFIEFPQFYINKINKDSFYKKKDIEDKKPLNIYYWGLFPFLYEEAF